MKFAFPSCGGCTSCELACSYKQIDEFNHHVSAVEVTKNPEGGYQVELHEAPCGERRACDGCPGVERPMCVRYCHDGDELMQYIEQMRECIGAKEA